MKMRRCLTVEWLEAVVHTTTFGSDLVSDEMMALGAAGCEIVDRADVPDPRQPGVYWELYDPATVSYTHLTLPTT